ncbi:DUF5977 domain-containing protein [Chitinophaga sp. S165]|uniref:DUF5977 domain-containing protein n=1 Tax=Chitinophaga sp. S165 TaxID=2135462 RepID=UPI000D70B2DC|nr:DUF5977 domain-containing protein [Chitinophaga sp. S165]PWV55749.1 PA14 domain-containing protein [Chitinophaga sp. S165]
MILELSEKGKKTVAYLLLALLYFEAIIPSFALGATRSPMPMPRVSVITPLHTQKSISKPVDAPTGKPEKLRPKEEAFIGGPTQPEMQAFASVNNANMVDLFTGNFSYSIPLLDVGGYPIAIGYNSGISMDQEASWVGLGWNINPGTITRNMRGLPDDFSGTEDTVQKVSSIKANRTFGGGVGADVELVGFPLPKKGSGDVSLKGSVGLFYNTYRGLGMEVAVNSSINAGSASMGDFSAGLSMVNSSQQGASLTPSLSYGMSGRAAQKTGGFAGNVTIGSTFSSRTGLKTLQLSTGLKQYNIDDRNLSVMANSGLARIAPSAAISFSYPSYIPEISLPYTSSSISVTLKTGSSQKVLHPNWFFNAYASEQVIKPEDRRMSLPAYGYLNYQQAKNNTSVLLDFNRERDIPYREKPEVPNIGIPSYTYDVFSMSGEGTGGMFRAYRGDIGYVFDHTMKTKDQSGNASIDLGVGDLVHAGVDLAYNRASTTTGPWQEQNPLATNVAFSGSNKLFEAAYFRNPGEMTITDSAFYKNIGEDDVVAVNLIQNGSSDPDIRTSNQLNRYQRQRYVGKLTVNPQNMKRAVRDKRTQVISYLTAEEAGKAGLSRYIENHREDSFAVNHCAKDFPSDVEGNGIGLFGEYFKGKNFETLLLNRSDSQINFPNIGAFLAGWPQGVEKVSTNFSIRWTGRLKAPVTGRYTFYVGSDDGAQVILNDSVLVDRFGDHSLEDSGKVNLVAGDVYNLRIKYRQVKGGSGIGLSWKYAGLPAMPIPKEYLYHMPVKDTFVTGPDSLSSETRVNGFRKKNHISEIAVLNRDGKRYVYGIPVYNLQQKEVTFSVKKSSGNVATGQVKYVPGQDNTVDNKNGLDHYFSSETVPAYAHSFLLTGILSPEYQDLTGDGISIDDPGDAIKFNYTKTAGTKNPYKWRIPAGDAMANYSEGLKTDDRDDKGSYVYGEKELWYVHSIESKNMIATFKLSKREDMFAVDENGVRLPDSLTRKLDEINLYTKADFQKNGKYARAVKTVHFEYSYELCPGVNGKLNNKGKLTLKKIWFTYNGNDKGKRNPYIFSYNNNNPAYNAAANDRWGNYKDALQNPGSTAENVIANADYPYALQDSAIAANNAAAWTLDSIVLPSGGRMKVTYESDDYAYVQNKRAAQLYKVAGFSAGKPSSLTDLSTDLYGAIDYLYVSINVPYAVNSNEEVYNRYLQGMDKLYFRLSVQMLGDKFGKGKEYIPCYATVDPGTFGFFNSGKTIWVRLKAIDPSAKMNTPKSVYSPIAESALQYLRLNLPSKAYPGSDIGTDDVSPVDIVKMLLSQADNMTNMMLTFDIAARVKRWAKDVDLNRSYVRLNNPYYKKYGGGLRVKKVVIYDHWDKMTKQRESIYGQEYKYTTTKELNGKKEVISSGVASYEPIIGGEENPWKVPVEYNMQVSSLVPVDRGYTELPYGEGFFPAPAVGYSRVRVRTIHADKTRSANGFEETCFYTGYDFPTLTDVTNLGDSKKRFKPLLSNLLRINARQFLALSQGFKVELNDMTGKIRSQASYPETDLDKPVAYTEYFYKVDDQGALEKHLNNTVDVITPHGDVKRAVTIGKEIELMLDMREQHSVTNGYSANVNVDMFKFFWPPVFLVPMLLNLVQREETQYRSVAATKIINRHGILDSVLAIDKGSRVTTRNLLYDGETGDPLLTSTQNEFNDPVYNFSYPVGWAYDGMSGAYKNIGVTMDNITMKDGRIVSGLTGNVTDYFSAGDEILVYSYPKTGGTICDPQIATFPTSSFIYAVNANVITGGQPDIYFVDRDGAPFTGNDITLKITRSGRRNIAGAVGSITSLKNPLRGNSLVLDSSINIVSASAVSYKQFWKVSDKKKLSEATVCVPVPYSEYIGGGSDCGVRYYGNIAVSKVFKKNNCDGNGQGSSVTYTMAANRFTSTISISDATTKARAALDSLGQVYANMYGTCTYTYTSKADSVTLFSEACQDNAIPVLYTYRIPAGAYTSTISQEDADSNVKRQLGDSARIVTNRNGRCYFKNDTTGILAYPVCASGIPVGVWVKVPAGVDTSFISKEAANEKARARYWAFAQAEANEKGTCMNGVYVQMTVEPAGTDGVKSYSLISVHFFADAALTIPTTVTDLTVNYMVKRYDCNPSDPEVFHISKVCNGTSTFIGKPITEMRSEGICWNAFYYLSPGTGYIPDPGSMEE